MDVNGTCRRCATRASISPTTMQATKGASGGAETGRERPPPQSIREYPNRDWPAEHTYGRRKEDAVSGDCVDPEGHRSSELAHRQGHAEKPQTEEHPGRDRDNDKGGEHQTWRRRGGGALTAARITARVRPCSYHRSSALGPQALIAPHEYNETRQEDLMSKRFVLIHGSWHGGWAWEA